MHFSDTLKSLLPKDKKFQPMFEELAGILVQMSGQLVTLMHPIAGNDKDHITKTIKELEKSGDHVLSKIYRQLNTTFITPFDREDIRQLGSNMDDVADNIHIASWRTLAFNLNPSPEAFLQITLLIGRAIMDINECIRHLPSGKNASEIYQACMEIYKLEEEADEIYHEFLRTLFNDEKDAIALIIKKEVYTSLEKTMDSCKDVADVIMTIMIKNN